MAETEKLRDMIDAMVNDNAEKASVDFHGYATGKMKEVLQGSDNLSDPDLTNQNKNDE